MLRMSEIKPKNCPNCNAKPIVLEFYERTHYYAACSAPSNCMFRGPNKKTEQEAIESWNSIQIGDSSENKLKEELEAIKLTLNDERRFQAACAAMQAIIYRNGVRGEINATWAIEEADSLLKELEK